MPGVEFYDHGDDSRYGFRDLIASPGGPCVSIAQLIRWLIILKVLVAF